MVYIIVEGQTDKALLNNLLSNKEENIDYKFLGLKGDGQVIKTIDNLTQKDLSENTYFAIIDADESFKDRNNNLINLTKKKNIDFFIFPNHKDDGDLETLILSTIDKKNEIIKCFEAYQLCVKKSINKNIDNKSKLYAYTTLEHDKKPEKYIETLDVNNDFKKLKQKLINLFKEEN